MYATLPTPRGPGRLWFRLLRVIFALVLREMGTTFGRSAGGYLWAILEPLGGIMLLAIAFGLAIRTPPLGTSFMLFYATGIIPFYMFNNMSKAVSAAVVSNRGLLTYPVVSLLDAVFAKFLLNLLTLLTVAVILFASIVFVSDLDINLDLGAAASAMALAAALGLGVGAINCVLFGFFPTWKNVWSVLTRPLFIVSGVFFTFDSVPKTFQTVLWWNPVTHAIGMMRAGFYGAYDPYYVSLPYALGVAGTTFVVGAYLLRRHTAVLLEQ
jgi:capsular polysaccharide transport system permease protein